MIAEGMMQDWHPAWCILALMVVLVFFYVMGKEMTRDL